jgi:hypothetical protein
MTKAIQFLLSHQTGALVVLGYLGSGVASVWPEQRPKTLDDWWNWLRDLVHVLGNAKRPTKP